MPPLNHKELSELDFDKIPVKSDESLQDLIIIRLSPSSELLKRQDGIPRKTVKLVQTLGTNLSIQEIAKNPINYKTGFSSVFIISKRDNYKNFSEVSIEKGCKVNSVLDKKGTPYPY